MNLYEQAENIRGRLIDYRRVLHQIPEIHCNLHNTMTFVTGRLQEMGVAYRIIEGGGIVACIGNGRADKAFLLRADMDALPITENSGEPFASKNGCMHACGHDLHTAMLLGAAQLLKDNEASLPGTVKLVFQCDEEGVTGMRTLIDGGLMTNPEVGAAMALHVLPGIPAGAYHCAPGYASSAVDIFQIKITGRSTHSATPQDGVDAINVTTHIFLALQTIVSRELSASEVVTLTNGYLHAGTDAYNVIPGTAVLGGGIRSFNSETAEFARTRLVEIAKNIAVAFHAECEVNFLSSAPACYNDEALVGLVEGVGNRLGMRPVVRGVEMVSEDFAFLSRLIPSCLVWIGAGGPDARYQGCRLHDANVRFNEDVIPYGCALLTECAVTWLSGRHT
ncbi:MAG: M20 family metallopeptidase [Oscillospiraceae bacterium]